MARLSDTDKHQARAIIHRMFQFGQDGRQLGRYLTAQIGMGAEGNYAEMREELIELLRGVLDSLYLAPPPKDGQ